MAVNTKVNGEMVSNMVKVKLLKLLVAKSIKVSGRMASFSTYLELNQISRMELLTHELHRIEDFKKVHRIRINGNLIKMKMEITQSQMVSIVLINIIDRR